MNIEEYRLFLLNNLYKSKSASGGREVVWYCPYCDDNGDHGHFYIKIPQSQDDASVFNCVKCHTHGLVTHFKLMEWGVFDTNMGIKITEFNSGLMKNPINTKYKNLGIYNLVNTFIRDGSEAKLAYINNRLGLDLSYQDIIDNKIVLNINDVLKQNKISSFTRNINFINELNRSFLGFLSFDNAFINLRKMNENSWIEDRYINYNIFDKQDNTMKFYVIPTCIDLYNPNPIKVHMAEGPFDILSIKYNLRKEFNHSVYAAVTGNAYKGLLRCLIVGMKLMNLEIHLYPDNDSNPKTSRINKNIVNDLIQFIRPYNYGLYIHKNRIGKDMGTTIDKIDETIEKIY